MYFFRRSRPVYDVFIHSGPFNEKEMIVITIMANVGFTSPYTTYIIWVQYSQRWFNQVRRYLVTVKAQPVTSALCKVLGEELSVSIAQ